MKLMVVMVLVAVFMSPSYLGLTLPNKSGVSRETVGRAGLRPTVFTDERNAPKLFRGSSKEEPQLSGLRGQ
jgi:hypothetical protein